MILLYRYFTGYLFQYQWRNGEFRRTPDRRTGNFAASVFILIGAVAAPAW